MRLLVSLLFVLASTSAFAGSKSFSFDFKITENYSAYSLVENKGTEILLELSDMKTTSVMTSEGQSQTETLTQLPRKERGELDTMTVKKLSDKKVLIISESVRFADTDVGPIKAAIKYELEADLTRGTWADLQNNLDVELKVTKKSKAVYEKQNAAYTQKLISTELTSALTKQLGYPVQVTGSLSLKSSDIVISGTLQRLTSNTTSNGKGRFTVRF